MTCDVTFTNTKTKLEPNTSYVSLLNKYPNLKNIDDTNDVNMDLSEVQTLHAMNQSMVALIENGIPILSKALQPGLYGDEIRPTLTTFTEYT